MLKGRLSTVMDVPACRAHQGMMVRMERTPNLHGWTTLQMEHTKDPLKYQYEAGMSSELRISYLICAACLN